MTSPLEIAAKSIAVLKYLNVLKDNHLVTPSMGKPYPGINTEESRIMHRALLEVQNVRIRELKVEISNILTINSITYDDVWNSSFFIEKWEKLKRKVSFLKRKFRSKKDSNSPADHSSRNRKRVKDIR